MPYGMAERVLQKTTVPRVMHDKFSLMVTPRVTHNEYDQIEEIRVDRSLRDIK